MATTSLSTYKILPGDNFYLLAKRLGVSLDQILQANPGIDPQKLTVGQNVKLPGGNPVKIPKASPGLNVYGDSPVEGESFAGKNMDHVGVNIGGVGFELKRVIDNHIPHEVHILMPRTEIRSVTRNPDCTVTETQIMISNINIVHSPRQ